MKEKPPYDYEDLKDWVMNYPLQAAEWIADHRVGGEPRYNPGHHPEPCKVLAFEGAEIHNNPDVAPCPKCGTNNAIS